MYLENGIAQTDDFNGRLVSEMLKTKKTCGIYDLPNRFSVIRVYIIFVLLKSNKNFST